MFAQINNKTKLFEHTTFQQCLYNS